MLAVAEAKVGMTLIWPGLGFGRCGNMAGARISKIIFLKHRSDKNLEKIPGFQRSFPENPQLIKKKS